MTIKEALLNGIKLLKDANTEAPAVEAGVMLCHVLGKDKTYIYSHGEYVLNGKEIDSFESCLDKRVNGMPVQYIIAHQEFMSLDFYVSKHVLIPRHDTEVLVETVMGLAKGIDAKTLNILDIGTGSGCIAISLTYYIKNCRIMAVDSSLEALKIASQNAKKIGVENKIQFLKSDLLESLESGTIFDIIVSNPPYIPSNNIKLLQREVRDYEPLSALDGGEDGLDFYRIIIDRARAFQTSCGILAFEVGYNQAEKVCELMKKSYCEIKIVKDISNIGRVVIGRLK